MLFEIKILVLTITLISFSLKTTADIISQPGYGKVPTEHIPIHSQPLVTPIQQQRESNFGHTQAQLIPIYANGHQGGAAYQVGHPLLHYPHYPNYPHYPSYPHYVHALPRYALPQRHLRVLKIGGRKVFQPLYPGQPTIPLAVHYRYKKSVDNQPGSEESGKTVPYSKDSSLDKVRSDMQEIEDKNIDSRRSKNDFTTETLYGLNPTRFMHPKDLEAKLNALKERNTDENNELSTQESKSNIDKSSSLEPKQSDSHVSESNSQIPPDESNLRNFPDPRPDPPEHKKSHKTTSTSTSKNSSEKIPLLGSPMKEDEIVGSNHVQQGYPIPSPYNYYYEPLQYGNCIPPVVSYQPVYAIRYSACNDDIPKVYDDQQSATQQQIHQATHAMDYPPNMGYVSSPQIHNYVPSYALEYPKTSSYVPVPYPIPYAQLK